MPSEIQEILNQSVTKDDYGKVKNGVYMFVGLANGLIHPASALPVYPPAWWSFERDDVLRASIHYESMWANAIYVAVSKTASTTINFRGSVSLQVKRIQELIRHADPGYGNRSKATFLQRHLRDYLMTDNGAFIEVIRATPALGSRIVGLKHLDSRRCRRTGDPDVPVLYRDRNNNTHEMKSYQVLCLSDMPDPTETYYGVGLSAASRAYRKIYEMSALETYVSEKVVGQRPLAIYFVNGVTQPQIEDTLTTAKMAAQNQGYSSYMGAAIMALVDPTTTANVAKIDLAGLPDRFDPVQERKNAYLVYADAIGIDPQEIDPELVVSRSVGTGSQAKVIDDKASGKGLASWRDEFMYNLNEFVAPETVFVSFQEKDIRDLTAKAQLTSLRTQAIGVMIQNGLLTAAQGQQMLVDAGDIPTEFVKEDLTTTVEMTDYDKPEAVGKPLPNMLTPQEETEQQAAEQEQQQIEQMKLQAKLQPPPPEGLRGGNPLMQTARQDQFKELSDLRLEQAFREIDIMKGMSREIEEVKENAVIALKQSEMHPTMNVPAPDMEGVADAIEALGDTLARNQPTVNVNVDMTPVAEALKALSEKPAAPIVVQVEVPPVRKHVIRDAMGRIADITEEKVND